MSSHGGRLCWCEWQDWTWSLLPTGLGTRVDSAVEIVGYLGNVTVHKGPLNSGHYGANDFVPIREVVPISEVK